MEQETYLDLSQEQEAYLLNNCDLLDYIYNLQLIEDEKYEMLLKIKKVFQKQISIIQAINYDVIKTNRSNKSNDGNISNIVDRNRNYMKIERLINNRETKELLEKTLFANHKTIVILETLDNDKDKLIELIINICDIIDELYNLIYNSSDYERRIKRLKEKIMEFGGIKKLSRKLKISKNTIKKILRGEVNFKYEFLERMERFLNNGFKK